MTTIKTIVTPLTAAPIDSLPISPNDGHELNLVDPGTYTLKSVVPWYYSDTDGLAVADMTKVDGGVDHVVSVTSAPVVLFLKLAPLGGLELLSIKFDMTAAEAIPVGGLIGTKTLVVSTTGNDSAGAADPYGAEFLTPVAAANAAVSGDTIVVRPGTYAITSSIARDGVNWLLLLGATITAAASSIFDDGGVAMTMKLRGNGVLATSGANTHRLATMTAASDFSLEYDLGSCSVSGTVPVRCVASGTVEMLGRRTLAGANAPAIQIDSGSTLKLGSGALVAGASATDSIHVTDVSAVDVPVLGSVCANKALDVNITQKVGTVLVDAAVV